MLQKLGLRWKHRILRILWLIITLAVVGTLVFSLYGTTRLSLTLLLGFMVGLILFIFYELVLFHELCEKDANNRLKRNSIFQIYISKIALLSTVIALVIGVTFTLPTDIILLILSALTITLLISTFPYMREIIESHTPIEDE